MAARAQAFGARFRTGYFPVRASSNIVAVLVLGTGLGLAVSRRLIERHGGTLRNVEQPRGALFEVLLPLP